MFFGPQNDVDIGEDSSINSVPEMVDENILCVQSWICLFKVIVLQMFYP